MKHLKLIIALSLISLTGFAQVQNLVGKEAPAVIFQGTSGKKVKPEFYKKKILVLDFWATWCASCIANFPHFNELSEKFASKDVVFALISDEPESIVSNFFERTQKEVKGLSLTDTTKVTKNNFGIQYIPSCVVIDENNIVKWSGAGQELTAEILDAIIKGQPLPVTQKVNSSNAEVTQINKEEIIRRARELSSSIFKFSISNGTNSSKGRGIGNLRDGDFSYYNDSKASLAEILGILSGYSPKIQFITNDTIKLKKILDVDFYSNSGDSTLFRKYASRVIPGMPRRNMIMELLGDALKFELNLEIKQQEYFEIVIDNPEQFEKFKSLQSDRAGISIDNNQFVITGYPMKTISQELKKNMGIFYLTEINDGKNYDLILDNTNAETIEKSLNFHGLKLVKRKGDMEFLNIDFY